MNEDKIIFNAERGCYPFSILGWDNRPFCGQVYPTFRRPIDTKFLNAGAFIGRAELVRKGLKVIL